MEDLPQCRIEKYPKINTLWKRDEKNRFNTIEGDLSQEEFGNIKNWHITEKIHGIHCEDCGETLPSDFLEKKEEHR